jgi:hypothetical protein
MQIESRTRRVRRVVEITEHRCWWCKEWFETRRADAAFCPLPKQCRIQASRAGMKGPRLQKATKKRRAPSPQDSQSDAT